MHQLSTLPDLCLFTIFDHLSLFDQHQLGRVCRRLRLLQLSVNTQRSKLELGFGSLKLKRNSIRFKKLTQQLCGEIVEHFPNVVNLQITKVNALFESYWKVYFLQHKWTIKLVSLSIVISGYSFDDSVNYLNLIRSLNSLQLTSLKSFTLRDTCLFNKSTHIDQLSILPQLAHFKYVARYGAKEILKLLRINSKEIILSNQLKTIELDIRTIESDQVNFLGYMKLPSEITSKFVRFSPAPNFIEEDGGSLLACFYEHFCSLKSIYILYKDRSTLVQQFKCLTPLSQLRRIYFCFIYKPKQDYAPKISITFPSVTHLTFDYYLKSQDLLCNLEVLSIFPNVNRIFINLPNTMIDCPVCQQTFLPYQGSTDEQRQTCLLHMIEPLKECANLKHILIYFNLSGGIKSIASFKWPFNTIKISEL